MQMPASFQQSSPAFPSSLCAFASLREVSSLPSFYSLCASVSSLRFRERRVVNFSFPRKVSLLISPKNSFQGKVQRKDKRSAHFI